ncbi:MAG TPA: two-component regulator propeller domain-containing protein [Thermoanaerobaculia bacterium]|nr:two-component regulator propeller domain-containing protein [Thermoanaerobaculia bacterium]
MRLVWTAVAAALFATAHAAGSQPVRGRLPLEAFTVAQGLANDSVTAILPDSRGFLWFGTLDGLSRYDGSAFVNYSTDDGLPDRMVYAVAEDREGGLWIGTQGGLVRMAPGATRGPGLFQRVPAAPGVAVETFEVFVDRRGTVWSACGDALCVVRNGRLEVDASYRAAGGGLLGSILEGPSGDLWVSAEHLFRRRPDGSWRAYVVQPAGIPDGVGGVAIDGDGRLWIATGDGFVIWAPGGDDADTRPLIERAGAPLLPGMALRLPRPGEVVVVTTPSRFPIVCRPPALTREGRIWQPCVSGLFEVANGRIAFYDTNDGLPFDVKRVAQDQMGDLWIATRGAGAFRLARSGAITWTRSHGLANERIRGLFELDDGTVCATNPLGVSCFGDGTITHASLWSPDLQPGWGWNQIVARDGDGSFWVASAQGLIHWPRARRGDDLARAAPIRIYRNKNVFRVWRDSRGRIWTGLFDPERPLQRLERDGTFTAFPLGANLPSTPTAFAEDRAGNIWVGLYEGGLLRIRDDRIEKIEEGPQGLVRDLEVDSQGGLWVGTASGLARIADPAAPANRLAFRRWSREDGLASNSGYCMVELPDGRMAIGAQKGLDVLDPRSGQVVHVSIREGLASNEISLAMVDRRGALWLGTINGLSRLGAIPSPPRFLPPPRLRVDAIHIDGAPIPVPELGATSIGGVRVQYPRHAMSVGFSAPHFDPAHPLRFEYRLLPDETWTLARAQRAIVFDQLPAGAGTLEIRAVTPAGRASEPARVSFTMVPAVWKRGWFLSAAIAAIVLLAFAAHRYRVGQAVALERVRTRAATDLHDDLGSSLSRISILSEVAKRKLGSATEPLLDEIAGSARGLVDARGDSIWSIDPKRDDVRSLLQRVRHFAAAVFESQSIDIEVRIGPEVAQLPLGAEQRRETYLILKEALNNAARHAHAKHVAVIARGEGRTLRIVVEDDGRGFALSAEPREDGGRGVPSMQARAERAGGRLEIASRPGEGTRVLVTVPL